MSACDSIQSAAHAGAITLATLLATHGVTRGNLRSIAEAIRQHPSHQRDLLSIEFAYQLSRYGPMVRNTFAQEMAAVILQEVK